MTDRSSTMLRQGDTGGNGPFDQAVGEQRKEAAQQWPAASLSVWGEIMFVGVVCLAQFCTQVGLGQTVAILHIIGEDFGIDNPAQLAWQMAGQSLTAGTFILISGRLGDIYGYKKMLICGFIWFSICNMVSGLAVYSNYVLFIFSRVLQGIGPAICLPNGIAIFGAAYEPGGRKAMVFAIFAAVSPAGSVIGSLTASLFALAWWPWAYWSFSIVLLSTAVVGYFVIPPVPREVTPPKTLWSFVDAIDLPGATCGVMALILFNFAWNQAPIVGWRNPQCIVTLIASFGFGSAFVYIEAKVSKTPLIPLNAVDSSAAFVLASIACGWGSFGIFVFYSWEIWLVSRHLTPLNGTAWVCVIAIVGPVISLVTGRMLGPWKVAPPYVMTISAMAFLIGVSTLGTAPIDQIYWAQNFIGLLFMPIGLDMSFPAGTLILSDAVPKGQQGIAASLVNTVVNYSMSLALGFAGTVEFSIRGNDDSPQGTLRGFRGAFYFAIGLAGFNLALCLTFVYRAIYHPALAPGNQSMRSVEL